MSAHTPGPWAVVKTSGGWLFIERGRVDDPDHDCVASLRGPVDGRTLKAGTTPDERTLADAALIAAAPDLLAACQGMLSVLDESSGRKGWQGAFADKCRAAIAKAEGR